MEERDGSPAIIAYTNPFRFVYRDENEEWNPDLDNVNDVNYDYVKLHRLSTSFDVGLDGHLCLHVGFNGALILAYIPKYEPINKAVHDLNEFLGELLLGGVYSEAVYPRDLNRGVVYQTGYFRSFGGAKGASSQIHQTLQTKVASPVHSIMLIDPEYVLAKEIHDARRSGKAISDRIESLSVELVLRGVTGYVGRAWAEALTHLWIGIEQIVSLMWNENFVDGGVTPSVPITGREDFLNDVRTWTTSTRLEMIYQQSLIDDITYQLLRRAKKARNDLVHEGELPNQEEAEAALDVLFRLIAVVCEEDVDHYEQMVDRYKSRDPIKARESRSEVSSEDVDYWMGPLPPIPGEKEWGNAEYETVYPSDSNSHQKSDSVQSSDNEGAEE